MENSIQTVNPDLVVNTISGIIWGENGSKGQIFTDISVTRKSDAKPSNNNAQYYAVIASKFTDWLSMV